MNYFERPEILYTIPFVLFYTFIYYKLRFYENKMKLSIGNQVTKSENLFWEKCKLYFPFLRFITIILLILSLAGPGSETSLLPDEKNGVDIMISLDG